MDKLAKDFNSDIIFSYGQKWVDHRRFTLRTLRDFGFAKRTSEGIIMEEVKEFTIRLKKMTGKPFSTFSLFEAPVLNVIWSIVAGERYDYDDPAMKKLQNLLKEFFDAAFSGLRLLFFIFPGLVKIRDKVARFIPDKSEEFRKRLFDFFKTIIEEHQRTMQVGQPRDYIDALLEESSKIEGFQEIDFYVTLMDFFIAGSETTSTSLRWSLFLLAQHEEIQNKLVNQIQSVVGDREVGISDRLSLPYAEATLLEIMRMSQIAPFTSLHATKQDVVFKGYNIPKNTTVVGNIHACSMNPDIWGDPEVFRPERFLSADGKSIVRNKAWIPFGVGKRACLGESLARDEFFLFLTNVIQNFRVTMPEDEPPHTLVGSFIGGTVIPEDHRILIHTRN